MNQDRQLTRRIIPFYLDEQPDSEDRMIQEIWTWGFEELEYTHDYIQWLFPLPEKSAFNPVAPLVDDVVIQAFRADSRLHQNLLRSLTVMLQFYGLQRQESQEGKIVITQSPNYPDRKPEWVHRFNHNYRRITRILKCLVILGCVNEAQAFYQCLRQIYRESSRDIGAETFQYWTDAVHSSTAADSY